MTHTALPAHNRGVQIPAQQELSVLPHHPVNPSCVMGACTINSHRKLIGLAAPSL
jgi:hypothetical protein